MPTLYYLMLPKADAEQRYDPMDLEHCLQRGGWVGVVSAASKHTLREVAKAQGIRKFKITEG